jgi:hypothetical protein
MDDRKVLNLTNSDRINCLSLYNTFEMMTKEKLIQPIQELPDSFSVEELFDRIILLQKVEIGLQQSNAGEVVTTEEAREKR